jgi:CDP-diacylglycerol--glycerol-3-phosphate 3-phosphatidyltransferase
MKNSNIPLYLTLFRLIISPLFFPFLLVYFLPLNYIIFNISLAILFLLIGLTDFFDGYYARKFGQETGIGKILDPIADKVLLAAVFIALVAIKKLWFFWAVLLIGRELFIGGLRQIACESKVVIHVSWLGKCKTAVQILCCTWIIANPAQGLALTATVWNYAELILILASCVLSWWSARSYYQTFKHQMSV